MSILDIYDSLPEDEKEIIDASDIIFLIMERKKARLAIGLIPKRLGKYYEARFGVGMGCNKIGAFVGLACSSCNRWIECSHAEKCPMNELMGDFDHACIGQAIKEICAT